MREATNLPVDMSEVLAQSQLHKEESSLSLNGFVKAVDTGFTATAKTDSPGRTTHSRRHTTSSVTSPTTPGLSRMRDSTVPTDLVSLNDSDDDGDMAAVHLNRLAESLNVTARPVMKSTAQLLAEPVTPPPMPGKSSGPSRRNSFQSNTLMFPLPGAPRSRSFNGGVQVLTDASIISMAPASPTASGNQDSLLQASTVITMDDQQLLCDPFQEVARFLDHVLHGAGLPSSIEEIVTSLLDQGNFHDAHSLFVQTVASLGRLHVVSYKPMAEDSHQFHNIYEHILHLIKRLSESAINLALCRLTISQAVAANNLNEGINQSSLQAPVTETSAEAAISEKEKANEDEFVALRPWKNLGQVPILSPDEIVRSVSLSKAPRRLSSAYSHMGDQAQDFDDTPATPKKKPRTTVRPQQAAPPAASKAVEKTINVPVLSSEPAKTKLEIPPSRLVDNSVSRVADPSSDFPPSRPVNVATVEVPSPKVEKVLRDKPVKNETRPQPERIQPATAILLRQTAQKVTSNNTLRSSVSAPTSPSLQRTTKHAPQQAEATNQNPGHARAFSSPSAVPPPSPSKSPMSQLFASATEIPATIDDAVPVAEPPISATRERRSQSYYSPFNTGFQLALNDVVQPRHSADMSPQPCRHEIEIGQRLQIPAQYASSPTKKSQRDSRGDSPMTFAQRLRPDSVQMTTPPASPPLPIRSSASHLTAYDHHSGQRAKNDRNFSLFDKRLGYLFGRSPGA